MKYLTLIAVVAALLFVGCASSLTYKVPYPPADEAFITMGDDPGTESEYTPKGNFVHITTEWHIPFPILGLITFGNAEPDYVFETQVIPEIAEMGGDSLSNARIDHFPRATGIMKFLGFYQDSYTIVTGQVNNRPD